ncbi:MAG: hypothetical protein HY821_11845 [Acidobacteria bacterium]|nr:hypothetical protein [Acidobacteriota bacterium]
MYAAVALTTAATLVLELSLTRIFSVVFYYHFAFLAISIALFGLGAGGVISYYFNAQGEALFRRLGVLSAVNAVAVVFSLALTLNLAGRPPSFTTLALVYFSTSVPFLFSGMVISLAIAESIQRVDRVYFFDLLGAAAGCLLVIPFLNLMGGPGAVLGSAVLFAAASAVWFGMARASSARALGVALSLALVALIIANKGTHLIDIRSAKGGALGEEVFVQWNSFSRISLRPGTATTDPILVIDADATTGIPTFDLDRLSENDRAALIKHGPGFAYRLRPGAKTMIIGAGGGWDVARALASGSKDVTAVEINPIIADTVMRGRFRDLSHRLYFRPGLRVVVEDGRSYVRRSEEKYQLIQATLVDTWASTAAGAYALSENNIYTTEAFVDYLSHLTPDGVLSFTRWGFDPPRESLRLLSLAREALLRLGETHPARHVVVVREETQKLGGWGATDTVVISRKPFAVEDLERAALAAAQGQFEIVYMPGQAPESPFTELLNAQDPGKFYATYPYDVTPVADDRPFFFYTVQPRDVWNFKHTASKESADFKVNMAVPTLFSLLAISLSATLVTLILPPLLLGTRLPRAPGVNVFLLYFLCLGAGYILVQVGLIQKLVLLLGHPTYALTVVIFSMLVSSGLGSYFSRNLVRGEDRRLCAALALIAGVIAVLAYTASPVVTAAAGLALPVKALLAVALIAPAGFGMGIAFPSGLTRLEQWQPKAIRWAWSLNAASSVLGSCAAIFLAIYLGLRNTLLIGAVLYLLALVTVVLTSARARQAAA